MLVTTLRPPLCPVTSWSSASVVVSRSAARFAASLSRLWPKPISMPATKSAESTVLSLIR